jgi:hypothetical protein
METRFLFTSIPRNEGIYTPEPYTPEIILNNRIMQHPQLHIQNRINAATFAITFATYFMREGDPFLRSPSGQVFGPSNLSENEYVRAEAYANSDIGGIMNAGDFAELLEIGGETRRF